MQDEIDRVVDDKRVDDVVFEELEAVVALQMSQIPGRARQQVVDSHHPPVVRQEVIAQVRAEESGRTRNHHGCRRMGGRVHTRSRDGSWWRVASPRPRL